MIKLTDFWNFLGLFILSIWILFTFHAVVSSFEGHMTAINIVVGIDLIIAIYFVFIKKKKS